MSDDLNNAVEMPNEDTDLTEAGEVETSFTDLLQEYEFDQPRRGQLLRGVVIQAGAEEVILDVGLKHDAIVPRDDLERLDPETRATLTPGEEVTVYVVNPNSRSGDLIVSVYRALSSKDWDRARELMESQEAIEAAVVDTNRGGVLVQFGLLRGFVPQSLLGDGGRNMQRNKRSMLGRKLQLKVIEVNQQRNRLVFSEKAAREEARREQIGGLTVGQVVSGRVVSLVDYGAFVDIGGIDGLIHISKLDWQHVKHPSEVLKVGDEVEVQIDDVDISRERISLNRKVLLPSPWERVAQKYQVNDLVTGRVTNIADFGVFVEIEPSVEGLVHLSEMSSLGGEASKLLQRGEEVPVRIISIDSTRQRIGLSMDRVTYEEQMDWMAQRSEADEIAEAEELEPESVEVEAAEDEAVEVATESTKDELSEAEPVEVEAAEVEAAEATADASEAEDSPEEVEVAEESSPEADEDEKAEA